MRAFILAAGFGTRLRPVSEHVPKALVPVCGKPLLERALRFCSSQGITEIGVNSHHLHEQVAAYRKTSPYAFSLFHERDAIRGTGGGLFFARDFLAAEEHFFACNVDIVYTFDLRPCRERFLASGMTAALLAVPTEEQGTILYERESMAYAGAVPQTHISPDMVRADYIGAALYRREFLDCLTADDFSVVPVWKRVGQQGHTVGVMLVEPCYWRDAGSPESLAALHFDAIDGALQLDLPDHLVLDRDNRRCFHRDLPAEARGRIGRYAWVEAPFLDGKATVTRAIVYADARLPSDGAIENRILTRYGEVWFE
ncbi:MAG: NTP transferase domain-containing protein [Chitinispirillaceae bacterium]|nr:NTP transferase domain-containing protein [Chitinispirillaceae bacterium]